MKNFSYDMFNHLENPVVVLSTTWHHHLGVITNIPDGINVVFNMNSVDEVSFDVNKEWDGKKCLLWDDIVSFKYIYIPDYEAYYEIYVTIDDTDNTVKHITAKAAGEVELGNRKLIDFHCNDETDINSDDYDATMPTVLYRPILPTDTEEQAKKKERASLLHRVLSVKCPDWSIGHVDETILNIQRTYTADNVAVYDFLTNTVGKEIDALFEFDSYHRKINVYDLYNTCDECGYRGDFVDECPKCGSKHYHGGYGKKTGIFLNTDNFATEINLSGNTDNVKNCLRMVAGDALMTASIINLNPNGSQYIYHFSDFMIKDMPDELVNGLESYNQLYDGLIDSYNDLTKEWYTLTEEKLDLEHTKMPETPIPGETTAEEQLAILEESFTRVTNPETVAVSKLSASTSKETATNSVKTFARVLIDPRYTVEIVDGSDSYNATTHIWQGKFFVKSLGVSDDQKEEDKDQAESTTSISVTITGNYEEFVYQKIMKSLDRTDYSLMTIFDIEDDDEFKAELKKYSLERLKAFLNEYNAVCEVITGNGVNATNPDFRDYFGVDLYEEMYVPYHQRSVYIQQELDKRAAEVKTKQKEIDAVDSQRNDIKKELNIKDYLGDKLYKILHMYLKEADYNNSNYISTGLTTVEILDRAKEFFAIAQDEVEKASKIEWTISETLNNLLNLKEFKDFKGKFDIGDWLVTEVDDVIYRLRLISVSYNYSNPESISFTFSNVDRMKSISDDVENILNKSQSMAGSYNFVAHQAKQGDEANDDIEEMKDVGVDSSEYNIIGGTNGGVRIDQHGILMRHYDDVSEAYEPNQVRINNNLIEFTDDNWATVKSAIGKINYTLDGEEKTSYGVNAETLIAGLMMAGDIYSKNWKQWKVGDKIYSTGTHIDLNTGDFVIGGEGTDGNGIEYSTDTHKITLGDSVVVEAPDGSEVPVTDIPIIEAELDDKQDKLTPGDHITIDSNNVISSEYDDFTGASSSSAGVHGVVPAPTRGDQNKFLAGDALWRYPYVKKTQQEYEALTPEQQTNGCIYAVDDDEGGGGGGASSLAELDDVVLTNPSNDDILHYDNGDWVNTTIPDMTGATSLSAGTHGFVPAPSAGDETKFLRGDGTWQTVTSGSSSLDTLTDTNITSPTDGQTIIYDSTSQKWVNAQAGNANERTLSYTEYQALSDAEKDSDTTFYLYDVNGDGSQFQPVIYSTTEREIGVWTDGKPLYQKTYSFQNVSGSTYDFTNLVAISNIDNMVNVSGHIVSTDGRQMDVNDRYIQTQYSNGYLKYFCADIGSWIFTLNVTLQYTKTTDTAGSGQWTPQGVPVIHYSLDEQIIGTWVDGSTLYQKTIATTSPTSPNTDTVVSSLSGLNIDKVVFLSGTLHASSLSQYVPILWSYNSSIMGSAYVSGASLKQLVTNANYCNCSEWITIQYTKVAS